MKILYTHLTLGDSGVQCFFALSQDEATGDIFANVGPALYRIPGAEIGNLPTAISDAQKAVPLVATGGTFVGGGALDRIAP